MEEPATERAEPIPRAGGNLLSNTNVAATERRSHSTEELLSQARGEPTFLETTSKGAKKGWGYKKKQRNARSGTDHNPPDRQYKSKEATEPYSSKSSSYASGLSSFKLPLSPRLMNPFLPSSALSPRVRLGPSTVNAHLRGQDKDDEEGPESDGIAASFHPNFRNEAKTLRLAVAKEVQKCARLQHVLHDIREKQRQARRIHTHHGQLLEELSVLSRAPSASTGAGDSPRELLDSLASIVASLLQTHQEEALLYAENDGDDEDDGLERDEDVADSGEAETSGANDIEPTPAELIGRKKPIAERSKANTKHRALSYDDLHGEEPDGSDSDDDTHGILPEAEPNAPPGLMLEAALSSSHDSVDTTLSPDRNTAPKGTPLYSEANKGSLPSPVRSSATEPSTRYERDPVQGLAPFKYPRQVQIPRTATELPRVVPHIVRQLSENDNLRRGVAYRHLLRHHRTILQLTTFLKERARTNVEEELHHLLISLRDADDSPSLSQQTLSSSQHAATSVNSPSPDPSSSSTQRVVEKSYMKNYLAQKALREKRDNPQNDEPSSPDDAAASQPSAEVTASVDPSGEIDDQQCIEPEMANTTDKSESNDEPSGAMRVPSFDGNRDGLSAAREASDDSVSLAEDDLEGEQHQASDGDSTHTCCHAQDDYPRHILERLISSERGYVQNLESAVSILASLIAAEFTPWDPHSAFLKLFSQLELMVAINREFLLRLEQHTGRMDDIGTCLLEMMPHFEIYHAYASTLRKLTSNIAFMMQKPALFRQSDELVQRLEEPLQRIFNYATLTNACVKIAPEGHSCQKRLAQAFQKLRELSYRIGYIHLPSVQEMNLRPPFAWPDKELDLSGQGRQLIRSSTFTKLSGRGEIIARKLLLFTDVCLICHELRSRELLLRTVIPLYLALIIDNGETSNSFAVVRRDGNEGGVFNAASREEKERWIDDLNKAAIQSLVPL